MFIIMIALQIKNIKTFMSILLSSDVFDCFLLSEASITTNNTFFIDGHQNKDFFTGEEWEDASVRPYDYSMWKDMKSLCFHLIKGRRTPVGFKFVLHMIPSYVESILSDDSVTVPVHEVKALVLNARYDSTGLTLTTGTSLKTFLPDKSADIFWDKYIKLFLERAGIDYEEK